MTIIKGIISGLRKKASDKTSDTIGKVAEEITDTVETFNPQEQATRRQSTDMLSDSALSKSVRPVTIIWVLILFTAALVTNWCGIPTDEDFKDLIFWALLLVLGFYFPGRDLVKTFTSRKK